MFQKTKILLVLIFALLMMPTMALASDWPDWAREPLNQLRIQGTISESTDVYQFATRKEMGVWMYDLIFYDEEDDEIRRPNVREERIFDDVPLNSEANKKLQVLGELRLIVGYNGEFHIEKEPTRAEVVTVLVRILKAREENYNESWTTTTFVDMKGKNHWSEPEVAQAQGLGIAEGYPAGCNSYGNPLFKFLPDKPVRRCELAAFLWRARDGYNVYKTKREYNPFDAPDDDPYDQWNGNSDSNSDPYDQWNGNSDSNSDPYDQWNGNSDSNSDPYDQWNGNSDSNSDPYEVY